MVTYVVTKALQNLSHIHTFYEQLKITHYAPVFPVVGLVERVKIPE